MVDHDSKAKLDHVGNIELDNGKETAADEASSESSTEVIEDDGQEKCSSETDDNKILGWETSDNEPGRKMKAERDIVVMYVRQPRT
jgi:hypothetical protein